MGNYRFKLSDMIPNSWIYKLRDMGKGNNNPTNTCHNKNRKQTLLVSASPTQFQPRKSYYFTRELPPTDGFYISPPQQPENHHFPHLQLQPPRKSSKQRRRRRGATINGTSSPRRPVTSPVSAGCNCRTTLESVWTKSDISPPQELLSSSSTSPTNFASSRVFRTDRVLTTDHQESFDAMVSLSRDVVIDVNQKSLETKPKLDADHALHDHNSLFDLQLAPIITKPLMFNDMLNDIKKLNEPKEALGKMETETVTKKAPDASVAKIRKEAGAETAVTGKKERSLSPGVRKFGVNSQVGGVRLRIHSPRVGSRKTSNHIQGRVKNINSSSSNATSTSNKMGRRRRSSSSNSSCGSSSTASSKEPRKKLSESFAVMKSSYDPQRDFRESMVEMIIENNIRGSKDLEDLLACYLCLNADEYHHLIIKVFKQIWFDLTVTDVRTK